MNAAELRKIAADAQGYMAEVEVSAAILFDKTLEWQRGPRAANTEPSTGWRYDDEHEPIPNDPTGEAAMTADLPHRLHDEVQKRAKRVAEDTAWLRDMAVIVTHKNRPKPAESDDPGPDWCKSCYRDHHYLQPVAVHPSGEVKYVGYCRWCRESPITPPPIELLRAHHAGKRITLAMWERATHKRAS